MIEPNQWTIKADGHNTVADLIEIELGNEYRSDSNVAERIVALLFDAGRVSLENSGSVYLAHPDAVLREGTPITFVF